MISAFLLELLFSCALSVEDGHRRVTSNHVLIKDEILKKGLFPAFEVVNTSSGQIRGKLLELSANRQVVAFLGIPYAEPPLGEKRFLAPFPYHSWSGTLDATEFGPLCVQNDDFSVWDVTDTARGVKTLKKFPVRHYSQSEDCLTLNVYMPKGKRPESNYSIMVYIHGGSYQKNGGRLYPGEWLASLGNVIVVTFNYRLGSLGFLSTGDKHIPGNSGLLDQVLVLKWIKANIEAFNGNPDDVTIFGNSAGGACVGLHMVSPLSQGLFHKAIAQSGSVLGHWAIQKFPHRHIQHLARDLHCSSIKNSKIMLRCLRSASARDVIHKGEKIHGLKDSLSISFAPVVDGVFLPHHPEKLIRQGQFSNIPFMAGVTKDELSVWMKEYNDPASVIFTESLMKTYLPHLVRNDSMSDINLAALHHAVYTEYVVRGHSQRKKEKKKRRPDLQTFAELISDVDLKAPTVKLAQLLAQNSTSPIYFYEFSYSSSDDIVLQQSHWIGVYHESELHYLFGLPHMSLDNTLRTDEDKQMSQKVITLWSNFAKYGNPTPYADDGVLLNFTWLPFQVNQNVYAVVGKHLEMKNGYLPERMAFWNSFIPLFTQYPMRIEGKEYCSFVVFVTLLAIVSFMTVVSVAVAWLLCYGRKQPGVVLGNSPTSV